MTRPTATTRRAAPRPRSLRWLRIAIPIALLLSVWAVTAVAHVVEEPNLRDAGTLSPLGTGKDGSSELARMLEAEGVHIERVQSSDEAVKAASTRPATIFAPTPDFLHPRTISRLRALPVAHRIVVVRPGLRTLTFSPDDVLLTYDRWATATVSANCDLPYAARAGRAAVYERAYSVDGKPFVSCYRGGLVVVRSGADETIYVGATDPFRNGRIAEAGNATLATGLLREHGRVIWIDLHTVEVPNLSVDVDVDLNLPAYRRSERNRSSTDNPLFDALPPVLWAAVVLGVAGAVLLALAQARRLGGPVAEPLPVLVPAAETVTGRGRLYARIQAREATLEALRAAAIAKLVRVVDPLGAPARERELIATTSSGPPPAADAFIAQLVARTGWPEQWVRTTLYGPAPKDDDGLGRAVAALDTLVWAVLRDNPVRRAAAPPEGSSAQVHRQKEAP